MGFSLAIKQDALVAAARHCCVCHRYKGLNMEVHHIDQEAEGGANTFENAIALCFDCHANAGHYNDNHPKGLKYSKPELRKARDTWYRRVAEHNIQAKANTSNHLHFRHMVLQDYQTAIEIFSGDLKEFPFPNSILLSNAILKFISSFYINDKHQYQVSTVDYAGFNTEGEIFKTYSDAILVDKSELEYPYFHATRTPKREELLTIIDKLDPFIVHLIKNNIEPKEFTKSVININYEGCGDDTIAVPAYSECFIFKKIWFSFLAITNISQEQVELLELKGTEQTNAALLTNVLDKSKETKFSLTFPKVSILPNQTVLVPSSIILAPFEEETFDENIISDEWMEESTRSQVLTHFMRDVKNTHFNFMGRYIRPTNIVYNATDRIAESEFHELDLNNLFVLNRHWHMGSCPHLFFRRSNSRLEYVKELLTKTPGVEMKEGFSIPKEIISIVIAELEDETTFLKQIKLNDSVIHSDVTLRKGETLDIYVNFNDSVEITGYYIHGEINVRNEDKPMMRNTVIQRFLKQNLVS